MLATRSGVSKEVASSQIVQGLALMIVMPLALGRVTSFLLGDLVGIEDHAGGCLLQRPPPNFSYPRPVCCRLSVAYRGIAEYLD